MTNRSPHSAGHKVRVCMPTFRDLTRRAFRCGPYEAEDVLAEIDDVDLIYLKPGWGVRVDEKWLRLPLYHDVSKKLVFVNPGLQSVYLKQDYDLFVVYCQSYHDIQYVNAIHRWRDHCRTSVCWIEEMWGEHIPGYKHWLYALSQFDYVFIGLEGSVDILSSVANRACSWLPGGVDALRFSPYPARPPRVIDVYSFGRRSVDNHAALLAAARRGEIFYVYDTFAANNTAVHDHRQHRELLANMIKRSRYFPVAPGKMDEQRLQREIGHRYYEGAAGGAVLIGETPSTPGFKKLFSWPDAVIQVQPNGSDIIECIATLDSEPERVIEIRKQNIAGVLLNHDWAYRWKEVLRIAGIEPSIRLAERERHLRDLASFALSTEADPVFCAGRTKR